MVLDSTIKRGRKVPNLAVSLSESPSVRCKILQEGIKTKKNTQTQNKCTAAQVFYKKKEVAIRTTVCCVLFPGEFLPTNIFQIKIFTWEHVYF